MYDGPGHYKHYKGGEYEVLGIALREETVYKPGDDKLADAFIEGAGEQAIPVPTRVVIYRPLTPGSLLGEPPYEDVQFWERTLEDFNAMVNPGEFGILPEFSVDATPPPPGSKEWQVPLPVPRFRKMRPVNVLYFGARGTTSGHQFIWGRATQRNRLTTNYARVVKMLPWDKVDGGLTPPGGEQSVAAYYVKDGWTCIAWANRLYDSRGGSNSAFFFDTTLTFDQCIETARFHFPDIIKRHEESGFPIRRYDEPVTRV